MVSLLYGIPWPIATRTRVSATTSAGDDAVLLGAELGDPHLDHVARLQIARRLHAVGDAGRGAGRDHVARAQRHELADIRNQDPHGEDHVLGVAALARLAVDRGPHLQRLRIAALVGGDQPRTDRRERVGALALGRRAAALHLERALGDVVDDAIAGDVLHRVGLADVARVAADDR